MHQTAGFPILTTERLRLSVPSPEAASAMCRYVTENREHLTPWEPVRPATYFTVGHWRQTLASREEAAREGRSLHLVLTEPASDPEEIVGHCTFEPIMRGAFQAAFLGYALARRAEGRGLMREALAAAIAYCFDELRLHRIMANYMPENERSARVLERLGFTVEGFAHDYLRIAGKWRSHVLTSLTNPAWRPE